MPGNLGLTSLHKYTAPLPLQDYFGLSVASLAQAEKLVSGSPGLSEKLTGAGLQQPIPML